MFLFASCRPHDVGGIFVVHGAMSVIALAWALFDYFYIRMQPPAAEKHHRHEELETSKMVDELTI
jgi:hypothetical protein